ncbi:Phage shock protein PspC (stress-responsive transcriptional regulator) [Blastococcus sp. DSM 46786]|uniref:PspC domain-containing protein n=1 Tax=Blastococcus sp. DSM 46786 TaxID=1798227 RepID=UPI0008B4809B|nr:PspC domain-containing protein [Blastococcus sp. DSM 46786]SEK28741.1 Phage shock protein PspC (stress-responsive transcriptional regulator) [Blastococcus sp. DSM 46786]
MTSVPPPAPPAVEPPPWSPPPGPPDRAQLRRSRGDKVIGGVSGGLAEYSGIDALLWRVGFVALALAGGTGVLVYLLLWLLMPVAADGAEPSASVRPATRTRVRGPVGPRSPVPGVTIAGLLILMGLLALLSRFTGWDPGPPAFLGTALLVVGAGLVVGAVTGGRTARGGLITLGVLLSLGLVTATATPSGGNGIGDRTYAPQTVDDVREVYSGGIGDLVVDLSEVPLDDLDETLEVRVDHGVGDVEVVVPRSADVRVSADQGIGELDVFGTSSTGSGYHAGSGSARWTDDGEADIELEIHSGIGQVEVSRG